MSASPPSEGATPMDGVPLNPLSPFPPNAENLTLMTRSNSELFPMTDLYKPHSSSHTPIDRDGTPAFKIAGIPQEAITRERSTSTIPSIRGSDSLVNDDVAWYNPRMLKNKSRYNFLAQLASIDVMSEIPHSIERARKTSIICTIGPKTNSVEAIVSLRKAGMNILRLNFSHGSYEYHKSVIDNLHKSYEVFAGPQIAVALDTKGPEIRTGLMKDGKDVLLKQGQLLTISTDPAHENECCESKVYMDYANLCGVVKLDSLIFIDDGLIKLQVEGVDVEKKELSCRVLNKGILSSRKGVNLPGTDVDLPSVSPKDIRDLQWGVANDIDFVFASFIRSAQAIREIREVLGTKGSRVQIISKIENQQGINNFDEIIHETDGIMVARGDMGIEIPVEKVFLAQKMIIAKCNILGKPVICATQMLESMTTNPRPTRAEVSDVANAVMDGADCVMLSGETAKGDYPSESVAMMHTICKEAESAISNNAHYRAITDIHPEMYQTSETVAGSAVNAAFARNLKAILVFSMSGRTARLVSKYRPSCPIVCVTVDPVTARQSCISRGVYPILVKEKFDPLRQTWLEYTERQLQRAVNVCKTGPIQMLKDDDTCVVIQGWAGGRGHSNTMRLVTV